MLASGFQERVSGTWPRGCQLCLTRPSSRPVWLGGNNRRTSLPRRSFVGSNMESRSSSKRVFPLRRNLRCRNSSTRKVWISRFKIFSRADGSGCLFSPHHVNQGGVQKATPQVTLYEPHTAEESLRRCRSGRNSQVLPGHPMLLHCA